MMFEPEGVAHLSGEALQAQAASEARDRIELGDVMKGYVIVQQGHGNRE
jgi:hypothetical protein